jgi:predicted PurR-regulated permease PerM
MDDHIRGDNAGIFEEDSCNTGGLWAFILALIGGFFTIMKYTKDHLLKIVFAGIFLYSSINITTSFSDEILNRSTFISINFIITFIAFAFVISGIVKQYIQSKREASDVNPSKSVAPNTLEKPIVNPSPNIIQSVNNPLLKPIISATQANEQIPPMPQVPQVASSLPQVASALPQVASALPQVASALPQVASSLPQVASSLLPNPLPKTTTNP